MVLHCFLTNIVYVCYAIVYVTHTHWETLDANYCHCALRPCNKRKEIERRSKNENERKLFIENNKKKLPVIYLNSFEKLLTFYVRIYIHSHVSISV